MKDISNFQFVWNEWIVDLIDDIFNQSDPEFRDKAKLTIRDKKNICALAEEYYKRKRRAVKEIFYGQDYEDTDSPRCMDFHKLSAIICRTLIEYKVFDFDIRECENLASTKSKTDTDWFVKNALINFRLAFYASVVFLYQSMVFKYSSIDSNFSDKLRDRQNLDLYCSKSDNIDQGRVHESFENCMVLDLAKRDVSNKSFDSLMYATIMYQLEEYNKMLLDIE